MGTTDFLSETGFAMIFLGLLVAAVFRKEAWAAALKLGGTIRGFFRIRR
jgi:hypothetical protein